MEELEYAKNAIGAIVGLIEPTSLEPLHCIYAVRNRKGVVVGLTCRVGRAVRGHIDMVQDLLQFGESILFIGSIVALKEEVMVFSRGVLDGCAVESEEVTEKNSSTEEIAEAQAEMEVIGEEKSYEILCKTFNHEANVVLEIVRTETRYDRDSDRSGSRSGSLYSAFPKHINQRIEVCQKCRVKWAVEGDENTRFFHSLLNRKNANSSIKGMLINGIWEDNPDVIKNAAIEHFSSRFKESDLIRPSFSNNLFRKLSEVDAKFLESGFSLEEVKEAVWNCAGSKAPGPDGYNFNFILSGM
ncbi:hypothetical protein Tco_0728607 [Tanacetum coccineum]|uniref:Uncharacterized protein n=1 Tax=Tanacetum coccineum TaxID=301880 RepID=A0ABQ4YMN4_9ASTR